MLRTLALELLAQVPNVSPEPNGLPGGATLGRLANRLSFSPSSPAPSASSSAAPPGASAAPGNPYQAANGKKAVVLSLLGALVVAAASTLVRFFVNAGSGIN